MDFDSNFQGLMMFAQEAPDCTWITHQLMKEFRVFKIGEFY
jgi:hypothetical protein